MNLQSLLSLEEELIQKAINSKYADELADVFGSSTASTVDKINKELLSTRFGISDFVHNKLILDLIYTYLTLSGLKNATDILHNCFECQSQSEFYFIEGVKSNVIPPLCEKLHVAFLNSKFEFKGGKFIRGKSKNNLIEKGAVYTKSNIVTDIVETTLNNAIQVNSDLNNLAILDFACGTGRFYESIIETLSSKYGISSSKSVLKYVYAIDIDPIAINITRLKAINLLDEVTNEKISIISNQIILRNALVRESMFIEDNNALKATDLNGLTNGKFDVVVSNPPYLVLKINKNKDNNELVNKIQNQVQYFRKSGFYHYSIEGMLNYYQLSIEAILSMVKPNGEIGIICPSSLFADISATKLRKHLLLKHKLRKIKYFAEKEQLFDNVSQATNIFYLQKAGVTNTIEVEENDTKFIVNLSLIKQLFPAQMEIPFITHTEWNILTKLSSVKKLKQIPNIRNRRGELDLTLFKEFITNQKTPFRLVRGNMIAEDGIKDINNEFVSESFINAKSSDFIKNDYKRKRLICQQISNAGLKKRLKFVLCDESDILGNSCNYLSADERTLSKLNLVLNSNILNWRFKITSTNNHINNYELDELPIADLDLIDEKYNYNNQTELDEYIGQIYGLEKEEIKFITQKVG